MRGNNGRPDLLRSCYLSRSVVMSYLGRGASGRDGPRRGGGGGRGRGGRRGRGRGRESGQGRRNSRGREVKDCLSYKLLWQCDGLSTGECRYSHNNQVKTVRETIEVPNKVPMLSAMKGDFVRSLMEISECRLQVSGPSTIDIVVSEDNTTLLPQLKEKYEILLSQIYSMGPGWCYIHREGVSQCEAGSVLKFREHRGRKPSAPGKMLSSNILREIYITESSRAADGSYGQQLAVKNPERDSETRDGLHKALDQAHGESDSSSNPRIKRKDVGIKIIQDHEGHMKEILEEAMRWFCDEKRNNGPFVLKLEARFGKVLWRNISEDVVESDLDIKTFAGLCFSDTKHSRIFNTDVSKESLGELRETLGDERLPSVLETLDVKFTIPGIKDRIAVDVRIRIDEENKPQLLVAKKNESKIIVFDVLCLHRDYDIRMTLNFYEMILSEELYPELYYTVQRLLKTISYNPDTQTVYLQTNRGRDWNVNFIRHKKREAYRSDEKLLLTVTTIQEFTYPPDELCLAPDHNSDPHIEIEFHNSAWECAFGRDVGLTKEKSLSLNMARPEVDQEVERAIPHLWLPEHILEDFQEFWGNLDSINDILSHSD